MNVLSALINFGPKELEKRIVRMQEAIPHIVTIFMAFLVGMVAYMMITVIMESVTGMKVR